MSTAVREQGTKRAASGASMRSVEYRGHRIKYVDRGAGQPIVFVHNGGLSHRVWDYQLAYFQRSHRVIAPDLLGWGESDRPHMRYSADDYAAQLRHLVDHLELDRFHLAGFCLGGGVALDFARRHPQRVRSLTVVAPATPKTIASGVLGRVEAVSQPGSWLRNVIWRSCETPPGRWLVSRLLARLQGSERALSDPSFRAHVRRMYRQQGQWRVFCNIDYTGFATVDEHTRPGDLPPTTLIWGCDNPVLKASAGRELAATISPERTEFWQGYSYMVMRERPAETNRVLAETIDAHRTEPSEAAERSVAGHDTSVGVR